MGTSDRRDLHKELVADLEQIEDNVALYRAGRDSAYQTVALELRNILLGERRGLLVRVLPDATFHPISDGEPSDEPHPEPSPGGTRRIVLFGHAEFRPPWQGQRASITLPIDGSKEPLPLAEWLRQWIVQPDVRIGALIRSTADEEVAHTQDERGKLLSKLAGAGVWVVSKDDLEAGRLDRHRVAQEMYQMAIVGVGEYVAHRVRELLAEA